MCGTLWNDSSVKTSRSELYIIYDVCSVDCRKPEMTTIDILFSMIKWRIWTVNHRFKWRNNCERYNQPNRRWLSRLIIRKTSESYSRSRDYLRCIYLRRASLSIIQRKNNNEVSVTYDVARKSIKIDKYRHFLSLMAPVSEKFLVTWKYLDIFCRLFTKWLSRVKHCDC